MNRHTRGDALRQIRVEFEIMVHLSMPQLLMFLAILCKHADFFSLRVCLAGQSRVKQVDKVTVEITLILGLSARETDLSRLEGRSSPRRLRP